MTSIIHDFNGKIIKNNGDNLFFYFPKTYDHKNNSAFHDALECALTMIDSHVGLNNKLIEENLPTINFRISMDYGEVEIAISTKSNDVDLFGSIVNECAKTNNTISHTGFVIGNRLYDIIKETFFTKYYTFDELKEKSNEKVNTCDRIFLITRNMENNDIYASTNFYHKEKQVQNIKAADNSNYNILLIDDDEDVLYTFEALLKREGYNVKSFSKPIDGFKQFIENNPSLYDLIILDIRMPDINGIKLYYQLKAINPYINILFITALDIVQELVDALPGIKINDIIRKPIASDRFLIKVRSMIKDYSYFKKYF
jgi:CheY-like chemotaxis protein